MSGYTGLLSFEVDTDLEGVKRFINNLKYFKIGVSWGGYESLAFVPNIAISNELSEEQIKSLNIPVGVIRISVGLENIDDLLRDLKDSLDKI